MTKAIVFDYGNTLIEFGPKQVATEYKGLTDKLTAMFGSCDEAVLKSIRDRQIVAPFMNGLKENVFDEICAELIEGLYGEADSLATEALVAHRFQSFVSVVEEPDGVKDLLTALHGRYRLGVLSNYPSGPAVRESLKKLGWDEFFDFVLVSGDIGYVKPHAAPFLRVLDALALPASDCVYVGDNWLADVQGAKRAGMRSVHTTQYRPYESFEPQDGDHEPDWRIQHIEELRKLFL